MISEKLKPEQLSMQLRHSSGNFLGQRRGTVGLSLLSVGALSLITLYQVGIIKHLFEPQLPGLEMDADKVNASGEAYGMFETPDGIIGLGSYAATMGLAAMGGKDRAYKQPWIPLLLAAKVGFDTYNAIQLVKEQATNYKAYCFWCLLTAGATFATIPLVIPEAYAAMRELVKKIGY